VKTETIAFISTITLLLVCLVNPNLGSAIFIYLAFAFVFFSVVYLLFLGIFLLIETLFKLW
jgi:hypothetical protein